MSESAPQKFVPRSRYSSSAVEGGGGGGGGSSGKGGKGDRSHAKDDDAPTGRQGAWTGGRGGKGEGGKGREPRERRPEPKEGEEGEEKEKFWQSKSHHQPEGNSRFTGLRKYMAPGNKRGGHPEEEGAASNAKFFGNRNKKTFRHQTDDQEGLKEYPEDQHHPLSHTWTMRFRNRSENASSWEEILEKQFTNLSDVSTVEEFWTTYSHLYHPCGIPAQCDYLMFQKGVEANWEDPANVHGCRISVRIPQDRHHAAASDIWEDILLTCIGAQWEGVADTVVGVVISARNKCEDIMIWLRHSETETVEVVQNQLKNIVSRYTSATVNYVVLNHRNSANEEKKDAPIAEKK